MYGTNGSFQERVCGELERRLPRERLIPYFQREAETLQRLLCRCDEEALQNPRATVSAAVETISMERVERRNGRIRCGFAVTREDERFERWLTWTFSKEELETLIRQCRAGELDPWYQAFLLLLVLRAPRYPVNSPKLKEFLD